MKRFFIIALTAALVVTGGAYAYTWTTGGLIIGVGEPSGDIATSVNATENQPDLGSVTDNLTENTTCGEVPTGDLFVITPDSAYSGDLMVGVCLTNTGSLIKAYQYINMKVYMDGSAQAGETPNYRVITLQNGVAIFNLVDITGGSYTLSVTGGDYALNSREPDEWEEGYTVTPELFCEAAQR